LCLTCLIEFLFIFFFFFLFFNSTWIWHVVTIQQRERKKKEREVNNPSRNSRPFCSLLPLRVKHIFQSKQLSNIYETRG
jgi:hypothetical protein